jgi:hypothetical protein
MSKERHDAWFQKNFIETDLMRPNCEKWAWAGADWDKREKVFLDASECARYEEYYKDYFKSDFGFTFAVRKDFAIKVLTLGYVETPEKDGQDG